MKDKNTISYFDEHIPEYSSERFKFAVDAINRYKRTDSSLLDLGCGTGNILAHLKNETNLNDYHGLDVSKQCLSKTEQRLRCSTHVGSILQDDLSGVVNKKFDFVIVGAVLHHLIGKSREESKKCVQKAIRNALALCKTNGYLIIHEPIFYPAITMDIIFWIKKLLSSVTTKRISVFGHWNNLGSPVVSYLSHEELFAFVEQNKDCVIEDKEMKKTELTLMYRLAGITRRYDTTVLIKKLSASSSDLPGSS